MLVLETSDFRRFVKAIDTMSPSHREAVCKVIDVIAGDLSTEEYVKKIEREKREEVEKELASLIDKTKVYEEDEEDGETEG